MDGEEIDIVDDNVILHDISMDFALKIKPVQSKFQPYCLLGLRADYLIDYKGTTIKFQGTKHELNKDLYDDFVDFTYGAILGIGLMYDNKYFIDIEYNPSISKNLDLEGLAINDRYFSLTLGVTIQRPQN